MSNVNLAAPGNEAIAREEEMKKKAAFWVWQIKHGQILRSEVDRHLAQMSQEQQEIMRHWLNYYRAMK